MWMSEYTRKRDRQLPQLMTANRRVRRRPKKILRKENKKWEREEEKKGRGE